MVRLHTSLLALTFATGLVLASSDDYQRYRRDYELELFERDIDNFDELEARSLFGGLFKMGEEIGKKAIKGRVGTAIKAAKTAGKVEHRGGSTRKIERKLKPSRRIANQLKPSKKTIKKQLKRAAKQANKNNNNNQNNGNQNRINRDLQRARKEVADADRFLPAKHQYHVQARRGLEDDEELFQRDLDAEEVFGREYYDLLDERDTFDDLD